MSNCSAPKMTNQCASYSTSADADKFESVYVYKMTSVFIFIELLSY